MGRIRPDSEGGQEQRMAVWRICRLLGQAKISCNYRKLNTTMDTRWNNALAEPQDQTRLSDCAEYDFNRALYRCASCVAEGKKSLHKYVDECPYFDDRAPA